MLALVTGAPVGFDGVTWAQITGFLTVLASLTLASFSIRKSLRERSAERRAALIADTGAEAQRDSVAVGSTERAVLVLDKALATATGQYERDMAQRDREIHGLQIGFERERQTMIESLRRAREAYDRAVSQHEGALDRLVVRDETIRELNDQVAKLSRELGRRPPPRLVVDASTDTQTVVETAADEAAINTCPHDAQEMSDEPGPSGAS